MDWNDLSLNPNIDSVEISNNTATLNGQNIFSLNY
jgi:hypothetical protein